MDDKILARAEQRGEPPLELSERMAAIYQEQMGGAAASRRTTSPRSASTWRTIFTLVSDCSRGAAYVVDMPNGTRDVYFSVRELSGLRQALAPQLDDLVSGARVEKDENKRDPLDFALWKGADRRTSGAGTARGAAAARAGTSNAPP